MARPRTFDNERAIEAAMRAFWENGYEATSTEQLCAATGLGRSSIYNAFTSKHELFKQALEHYMTDRTSRTLSILDGEGTAREKARSLLRLAVTPDPDDPLGCLVVNSQVELAPHDSPVAASLSRDRERQLAALTAMFEAARRTGEIAPDKNPAHLALFLNATIGGMQVVARAGADQATLDAIADTALDAL